MQNGTFWRALEARREKFIPMTNELCFEQTKAQTHLLVDERRNLGLGIVRGKGREFVVREGKRKFAADELRKGVRTTHADGDSHLGIAWNELALSGKSHAFIGNGNLLSNSHFVGYRKESEGAYRLFALGGEPFAERSYSCLVVWNDYRVSVEDLVFQAHNEGGLLHVDCVHRAGQAKPEDLRDQILCATYGQRLVRAGQPVYPEDMALTEEFYDSRHVLLNPYYQDRFDFGMDQLMSNPSLYRAAAAGQVVSFETRVMGHRLNLDDLRIALATKDYVEGEPQPGIRGVYRMSADGRYVDMTMHLALYSHNTFGIRHGNVHVVQFPGLSNRAGVAISDMSKYLAKRGFDEAILLDNGGDVVMFHGWGEQQSFPGPDAYATIRGPSERDRIDELRLNSVVLFVEAEKDALLGPWNDKAQFENSLP